MNKPHKHADAIKAWADGAQIQCADPDSPEYWEDCANPDWHTCMLYRVKPAPLERFCGVTILFDGALLAYDWWPARDAAARDAEVPHAGAVRLGKVLSIAINPENLTLVSATLEDV